MAYVIDLSASHAAMRAYATRALEIPFVAGLIVKPASLHPVILPATGRIKEIDWGINVASRRKQIELFGLLALERKSANIARGAQCKKVKRNRGAAEEHVLIVAMADRHSSPAQLH